ncbi:SIMPL domain-containing protein [Halobacillus sp. B23F22_1]|uniref:SIMPL domain-containing protein n=1 Tax=Halobacillus sp. B23F22_1 TaxID=3459514 RepID=UPI00373E24EF
MNHQSMQKRVMTVTGEGSASSQPDVASLQVGVVTESMNLTQAQQENARVMERVIASIVSLGVPRASIQTSEYTILPQYDYDSGSQVFRGYEVTNIITVKNENIGQTGEIIDTAVQNGANRVSTIQFSVKNPEALYQQALSEALRDAYLKANTLAGTMRAQLDPAPMKVMERGKDGPVPLAKAGTFASSTPIEPGQLEVEAAVEVQFQFFA